MVIPGVLLWLNSGGATAVQSDKFYSMIEKTAQQSKIRYGYTLTIPEKGDQFSVDVKSLAEYDAATENTPRHMPPMQFLHRLIAV